MIPYEFKVTAFNENKKHFIPFMMKLYELSDSLNFAINKIKDQYLEDKVEFDIECDNISHLISLYKTLPDEGDIIPFKGVIEFYLQFEVSSYNNFYKRLLHSLIDQEVFQITMENSFSNTDFNKKVTIKCSWKENLESIIKKLPKESDV